MEPAEARAVELITDLLRGGLSADEIADEMRDGPTEQTYNYPEPDKVKAAEVWVKHTRHLLKEAQAEVKKAERRLDAAIRQAATKTTAR